MIFDSFQIESLLVSTITQTHVCQYDVENAQHACQISANNEDIFLTPYEAAL